ncbi:MAG TPA: helix-turn-helix transcriptional regulator [Parafilimonas sp.]|nr:helix-turn-helix transcriptional regulator [Parafilimonas sp.]
MKARHLLPPAKIAAYVDRVLVIEENQLTTPFILPLYANGVPVILFKSVRGKIDNNDAEHLTLFGQTVLPELLTLNDAFTLIAYFFKPYTLTTLFGVEAHELTDRPTGLSLLSQRGSAVLQERLLNAGSADDMIVLLDEYIFDMIQRSKTVCPLIQYATTEIANNTSKESLIDVQKQLYITERTFQRMFEKNVGVAPNLYRRICQFNSAFVQLNQRRHYKLSDIAFQNGYADQSHYIRSFKEFTNITPTEYLNYGSEE